ncbi:MAG: glycosyltransferase family 4 protein [Steroidobacteraceae bacterium]
MANQTRQLARLLASDGVKVRLVCSNEPYSPAWLGKIRGVRAVARLLPYRRALASASHEVDVMHVMANSGWAWFLLAAPAVRAALRRDVPVIINYRGGLAREFLASAPRVVASMLRAASAVIVPSRFLQGVFAEHGISARIIPNVVNLELFRPVPRPEGRGRHIVIARSLEAIYGIDTAIRAAAKLHRDFPDLTVSIAGSGPERAPLERLAAELGVSDRIRFTGRLEPEMVAELYGRADIALNPSRVDNTPNSVLEAAASGVPIVSTNVGGVPFLVEHGRSAWLVPPDDPALMAEGVARLLRHDALRDSLCAGAAQVAQSCSWAAVGGQWLTLYRQLSERRSDRNRRACEDANDVHTIL